MLSDFRDKSPIGGLGSTSRLEQSAKGYAWYYGADCGLVGVHLIIVIIADSPPPCGRVPRARETSTAGIPSHRSHEVGQDPFLNI